MDELLVGKKLWLVIFNHVWCRQAASQLQKSLTEEKAHSHSLEVQLEQARSSAATTTTTAATASETPITSPHSQVSII